LTFQVLWRLHGIGIIADRLGGKTSMACPSFVQHSFFQGMGMDSSGKIRFL
jgi:hypothetical protein